MLTTVHDDSVVTKQRRTRAVSGGVEEVRKPLVIERYNQFMIGVDVGDQLLSYYGFSHRTLKWWRRAFFHLIEVANCECIHHVRIDSTNRTEDDAQGVPHSTGEGAVVGDNTGGRAVPWTSLQSESTFVQIDRTPLPC